MDEIALLPCPFCGSDASIRGDSGGYCVVCDGVSCYCALGEGYDRDGCPDHSFASEDEAAEKWNRRSDSADGKGGRPAASAARGRYTDLTATMLAHWSGNETSERGRRYKMSNVQAVPKDHPLMQAWEAHKQTEEFSNSKRWASAVHKDEHLEGSLWAMFVAGWQARGEAIARLT